MAEPWRERLLPAQIAGVAFLSDRYELEGGRTVVVHEFPSRDLPQAEELGRRAVRHALSAYVLGPDYDLQRDRLTAALGKRSVGAPFRLGLILRHPWLGVRRVLVEGWRLAEDSRATRMARFELRLVEVPEEASSVEADQTRGTSAQPSAAAAALEAAGAADLEEGLAVEGPESLREASRGALSGVVGSVRSVLHSLHGAQAKVELLEFQATSTIGLVEELALAPANLASSVLELARGVRNAASSPLEAWRAYTTLLAEARALVPAGRGAESRAAHRNATLVDDLFGAACAAGAVVAAADVPWETLEDAQAARDELLERVDEIAARADPATFDGLQGLSAALRASVPPPLEDLPRLEVVDLGESLPAVVVAYRLFDDLGLEEDLAERNGAVNPARLPAVLQVLTGGRS